MNGRRLLAGSVLAALLAAALWSARLWAYAHPKSATKLVEMPHFTLEIPIDWVADISDDPRLKSDRYLALSARLWNSDRGEDVLWRTFVVEESTDATVASAVRFIQKDPGSAVRPDEVTLANGIIAKTWVQEEGFTEIVAYTRWYVFQMPNGRVYTGNHWLPTTIGARWRLENQFRAVLGSLKVKEGR